MKVNYENSIQYKVKERINALSTKIILRNDLADLAEYRQISRALNALVRQQRLAKIGKGVYAKMRPSVITGQAVLDGAFTLLAREALDKLKVKWEPESAEAEYNAGKGMQVPVSGRVRLKSRFSRKLGWNNLTLDYERAGE